MLPAILSTNSNPFCGHGQDGIVTSLFSFIGTAVCVEVNGNHGAKESKVPYRCGTIAGVKHGNAYLTAKTNIGGVAVIIKN